MYKLSRQCSLCNKKVSIFTTAFIRNCKNSHGTFNQDLDIAYNPEIVELQETDAYFKPALSKEKPFSLVCPPPNITGTLHLGHALTAAIEDVLVRWKRMQGIETMWVPGIDHAGIATQVVVEKRLWQNERKTRYDIGREKFREKVWEWKAEKAAVISQQLRRLGVTLNWEKESFTMDQRHCKAVQEAFIKLFDSGLIYRADYLVNWSCVLQSAISDIEVEHLEVDGPTNLHIPGYQKPVEFGNLYMFAYKVGDSEESSESGEEIVVATTRPETILGDVAVAVHPADSRYSKLLGRDLWHPFRRRPIPVISDPFVDTGFGTGAVKITPAHDHTDFEMGKKHSLPTIQVIDESGRLTNVCGDFQGLKRFEARDAVLERLGQLGLFRGKRGHKMHVPICSRSKDVVELLVRPQWFVKCDEMASRALDAVKDGRLSIQPETFQRNWHNWLENIRDWCISRQLWWGHQIPAYHCSVETDPSTELWVAAEDEGRARSKAAQKLNIDGKLLKITRDEDVLDTWFSSALQPFAVFGWPDKTVDLAKYFPLSMMETGHDILFFWVARMVMLGTQLTGELPFRHIFLHGIVCDAQGRKMSKSLGNVIAPEDVINGKTLEELEASSKTSHLAGVLSSEEFKRAVRGQKKMFPQGIPRCGADALRFTLVSHNVKHHFINFEVAECHANRLFCNKIWQATRFVKLWCSNVAMDQKLAVVPFEKLSLMDKWVFSRLTVMVDLVTRGLVNCDFHIATLALKNFLYYDFCDIYLESTKRGLRSTDSPLALNHCYTLLTCLDVGLRSLAPFMPSLAQHLHRHLPWFEGQEKSVSFPQRLKWSDEALEKEVESAMELVIAIRRLKKIFNVSGKHKPEVYLIGSNLLQTFQQFIQDLSTCHKLTLLPQEDAALRTRSVEDTVRDTKLYLVVPEEAKKSLQLDLPKMQKKKEKLCEELEKLKTMMSDGKYKLTVAVEKQEDHHRKVVTIEEKIGRINYIQSLCKG